MFYNALLEILDVLGVLKMARPKHDGRGRLGGRAKGTINRPLTPLNEWITGVINRNRSKFEKDLAACTPQERAGIIATLIAAQGATFEAVTPQHPVQDDQPEN